MNSTHNSNSQLNESNGSDSSCSDNTHLELDQVIKYIS